MSKKLFKNPIIFFENPGFDDSDEEDEVDGSGHGAYYVPWETWKDSDYAKDLDGDGDIDEDDYRKWLDEHGFGGN